MDLSTISGSVGAGPNRKRVGRGPGSGHGKTSGYGAKGARSRSGYSSKRGFMGGQKPLYRQVAKRGFGAPAGPLTVTLTMIERRISGDAATSELMRSTFGDDYRVVGGRWTGRIKTIDCLYITAGAAQIVQAAGSELIAGN